MNIRFTLYVVSLGGLVSLSAQVPQSPFIRDPWPEQKKGPVKVFLLAGQSNMQGQGSLRSLEWMIYNPETAPLCQQWKDRMGRWTERHDVWIWTTDGGRYGYLRPGFGADEWRIGPELGFGWVVGEAFDEQVLLIKTCWGGRSLKQDFLPPGAKLPPEKELLAQLQRARRSHPELTLQDIKKRYGAAYREMVSRTHEVLNNLNKYFPSYKKSRGYELVGFVWFQGWNDMIDRRQRAEKFKSYTDRLVKLIQAVSKEFNAPNMKVVIGGIGVGGKNANEPIKLLRAAQAAVAQRPELKGRVQYVDTARFWDEELEKMFHEGVWKGPNWPVFYNRGSQPPYHYLGSSPIYYRIGLAMGKAMVQLLKQN